MPENDSLIFHGKIEYGKLECILPISETDRYVFRLSPENISFRAILEPGEIKIWIDTLNTVWYGSSPTEKWGIIWKIKQMGTECVDYYNQMQSDTKYWQFWEHTEHLYFRIKQAKDSKDSLDYLKGEIDLISNNYHLERKKWLQLFINQNPESSAGPFILYEVLTEDRTPDIQYYENLVSLFKGNATEVQYLKQIFNILFKLNNREVGNLMPNFSLRDKDGSDFQISNFSGKYILLDFWASWCSPCRESIPKWKLIYDILKEKDFEIIGISIDKDILAWNRALQEEKMPWVQLIDGPLTILSNQRLSAYFNIQSIPFYILISPEGRILKSSNDSRIISQFINEVFKN